MNSRLYGGVIQFDVSIIGEVKVDGRRKFRDSKKHVPVDELRGMLPSLIDRCEQEPLNLIIRPRVGADRRLVQFDDLSRPVCA